MRLHRAVAFLYIPKFKSIKKVDDERKITDENGDEKKKKTNKKMKKICYELAVACTGC